MSFSSFPRNLCILLLCALSASACKSGRGLLGNNIGKSSWKQTLAQVETEAFRYESLRMSGKADIKVPGKQVNMNLSYRIQILPDSLIWIRASKLGIEGLRALITRDSIFVIDRTQNQYHVSDLSLAEKYTGLIGNFDLLEDLLVGNLHLIPDRGSLKGDRKARNPQVIRGSKAGTDFSYAIDAKLLKLLFMTAENPMRGLSSKLSYSDFERHGSGLMPQTTRIDVIQPEAMSITFSSRRVEVNPDRLSFSFNVPRNYDKVVYD